MLDKPRNRYSGPRDLREVDPYMLVTLVVAALLSILLAFGVFNEKSTHVNTSQPSTESPATGDSSG